MNNEVYLTVNELSERTKYARSTIYRWIAEKSIPFQRWGRHIRFSESDVIRIITQKANSTKEYNYGKWYM